MCSEVVQFLHGLEGAECLEDCFAALVEAVEALGYDAIAYTAIPQMSFAVQATPIFLTSPGFSKGFLKHYVEANWVENDFTVESIVKGNLQVMNWADELQKGDLKRSQKDVIVTAREDYGLRNAISIPTQSDEKIIAGASVVSEQKDASFCLLNAEKSNLLKILIQVFHDHVFMRRELRSQFYRSVWDQFTDIEIRLMRLVVSGHTLKMSRELCGVSPTRAGNILSSLYKRMDVRNAGEFAYLVGSHELVGLTE